MNKRKIRCYKSFASIGNIRNIEVYYTISETYNIELYSCLSCGEKFVVDFENPNCEGKAIKEIVDKSSCPSCGKNLFEVIAKYPEKFKYDDIIGEFTPSHIIPPDNESEILEVYEIKC